MNDLQDANKTEGSIYIYFLQLSVPKFYNQNFFLSSSESKWPSVLKKKAASSVFLLFESIFFFISVSPLLSLGLDLIFIVELLHAS